VSLARLIGQVRVVTPMVVLVVIFSCAGGAYGQDEASKLDPARLREKLAELKTRVASEEDAIAQAQRDAEAELQTLRKRRAALGEQAVSLQTELVTLNKRREELSSDWRVADDALRRTATAQRSARVAATALAERLRVYLREVPAHDDTREALANILTALNDGDVAASDAAQSELAVIAESVLQEASMLAVKESPVWTAGGKRETVTLLIAGHIAFAYRAPDGRLGITLNSPSDATGYRWTEDLAPEQAALIAAAIDAAKADSDRVLMPLDVSGQLRIDTVKTRQTLEEWFASGGPIMFALAGVAVLAMLLILERAVVLYVANGTNRGLVFRVMRSARALKFDDAESMSRSGRGAVARTLAACLERRGRSLHAMEDSVQEQLLHEMPRLERFLGGIAILAAVAPLLGLLGTVTGIIQTFGVIRSFGNANPGAMAGGISEALVTTAAGLVIAIPILLLHGVLRGRVERIIADAEKHAATLLNVVAHDTSTPLSDPSAAPPDSSPEVVHEKEKD